MANKQNSALYDAVDYLKTPEDCAYYLEAALEDGDEQVLLMALRNVAIALGGTVAGEAPGKSPSPGISPRLGENDDRTLGALPKILRELGFELSIRPKRAA